MRVLVSKTTRLILAAAVACCALSGCGYSIRAPYDTNIRTVYLPTVKSQSFRRGINFYMQDLLVKEIQKRTPYKVVGSPDGADTILECTVNFADKNIIVESPFNLPRQLTATLNASVNWTHNPPTIQERLRGTTIVADTINFVPEIGETAETGFYRACQDLAVQIVDMMEDPWYAPGND